MTKERHEQLSNRLVLNFAFLLLGGLALLYVNTALRSGGAARDLAFLILLIAMIAGAVAAVLFFVLGTVKKSSLKNYSAVGLGIFIGSFMVYASKLGFISAYDSVTAVIATYIAMAIYFIVLSVVIGIQLRKPIAKDPGKKIVHAKKRK